MTMRPKTNPALRRHKAQIPRITFSCGSNLRTRYDNLKMSRGEKSMLLKKFTEHLCKVESEVGPTKAILILLEKLNADN